ncbi:MAG: carboxypeptidase-like regulatory domain-containing protein [Agriterribacter sp.]
MQKLLKLLPALLLPVFLFAQGSFRVAGKVVDATTKQPLQGASVFCQNTTIGTVTNESGEFHLMLNNGGYELAISYSGLETQSVRINNTMPDIAALTIELKPKEKSLEEVAIVATNEVKNGWEKYGKFLSDNFIGKTVNDQECVIENPQALHFFFSKKRNRLKVTADTILTIQNKSLGYTIKYELDSFVHEYNGSKTIYTGYPFYEQMQGTDEEMAAWKKARQTAYEGSVLQFMRSYRDSSLKKNGYKIELIDDKSDKTSGINNPYDTLYYNIVDYNKVSLFFPGKLRVVYSNEKPDPAYLEANKLPLNTSLQISILDLADGITVEENGYYFDQKDVLTLGYWGWEKMGAFLPYDYYPDTP